jgi:hypothetical protein
MTSWEKGESGVFWAQLEELGPTKGAWNCPKGLKNLPNPHSFKISCYLPAGGTVILMTSGEKCENVGILGTNGEIGPQQGGLELPPVSQKSLKSSSFQNQFFLSVLGGP